MTTTSDAARAATTGSGDLRRLQQQLRDAGFYQGELDGRTEVGAALRDFRFVHGLGDDDTVDDATSAALDAGLRLTPTMAAILHDERAAISALSLVGRIAVRHPTTPAHCPQAVSRRTSPVPSGNGWQTCEPSSARTPRRSCTGGW